MAFLGEWNEKNNGGPSYSNERVIAIFLFCISFTSKLPKQTVYFNAFTKTYIK